MSFGQTPQQLFTKPHAARLSAAESLNLSWASAIASAKLSAASSARFSVVNTTHRAPVHAILLPFGTTRVATIDTRGGLCSHVLSHSVERGGMPCVWTSDVDAPRIVLPSQRGAAICTAPLRAPGRTASTPTSPKLLRKASHARVGSISLPSPTAGSNGGLIPEQLSDSAIDDPLGFPC